MRLNTYTPLSCSTYHLTMAQAMFENNTHETNDVYEMFIRVAPFKGTYLLTSGLAEFLDWLSEWRFSAYDINYLRNHSEINFKEPFLDMLLNSRLNLKIDAIPEGDLAFPNEPILRVSGPAWQCLMIEEALLQYINSNSLLATKSSRIRRSADIDGKTRTIFEGGARRSQSECGAVSSRAVFAGGANYTANEIMGRYYNIPTTGTMAHAFITQFKTEVEAFKAYIRTYGNKAALLIDTYDTIQGAKNAVQAVKEMRVELNDPTLTIRSVRLDSGDLGQLSKEVRKIFDAEDEYIKKIGITASSDLDEYVIEDLIVNQKAPIDNFLIGTMAVTAYDQPSLGGVYKMKESNGVKKIKVSETPIKTTIPGATSIIRILDEKGMYNGDIICSADDEFIKDGKLMRNLYSVNILNETVKVFTAGTPAYCPLVNVMNGSIVSTKHRIRPLTDIRTAGLENMKKLDDGHKRLKNPTAYVTGLEQGLFNLRNQMIQNAKGM